MCSQVACIPLTMWVSPHLLPSPLFSSSLLTPYPDFHAYAAHNMRPMDTGARLVDVRFWSLRASFFRFRLGKFLPTLCLFLPHHPQPCSVPQNRVDAACSTRPCGHGRASIWTRVSGDCGHNVLDTCPHGRAPAFTPARVACCVCMICSSLLSSLSSSSRSTQHAPTTWTRARVHMELCVDPILRNRQR